jgi:tRNA-binding protein
MATFADFEKLDIRIGRVVAVEDFPEARKPSYKLRIDFGSQLGTKKSCAQLVPNYAKSDLLGRLVLCVVNLSPRQIGHELSEVLTLGVPGQDGECVLVEPERSVEIGSKLY